MAARNAFLLAVAPISGFPPSQNGSVLPISTPRALGRHELPVIGALYGAFCRGVESATTPRRARRRRRHTLPAGFQRLRLPPRGGISAAQDRRQPHTVGPANEAFADGYAELIAFGRAWLSNPDVVARLQLGASLNPLDQSGSTAGRRRLHRPSFSGPSTVPMARGYNGAPPALLTLIHVPFAASHTPRYAADSPRPRWGIAGKSYVPELAVKPLRLAI